MGRPRTCSAEGSAKRNLLVSWLTICTSIKHTQLILQTWLKQASKAQKRQWCVNASAAFANALTGALSFLHCLLLWYACVTCLSISRRAYLMLGSSKVIAGLLLEKNSLKMRLMMLSKPPRISCNKGQMREHDSDLRASINISYRLFEPSVGRCLAKRHFC